MIDNPYAYFEDVFTGELGYPRANSVCLATVKAIVQIPTQHSIDLLRALQKRIDAGEVTTLLNSWTTEFNETIAQSIGKITAVLVEKNREAS